MGKNGFQYINIISDKNGKVIKSSSKNPYKAKCSKVNANIGLKDNSSIAKKIRLKGQKLGSVKNRRLQQVKCINGMTPAGWDMKVERVKNYLVKRVSFADVFGEDNNEPTVMFMTHMLPQS